MAVPDRQQRGAVDHPTAPRHRAARPATARRRRIIAGGLPLVAALAAAGSAEARSTIAPDASTAAKRYIVLYEGHVADAAAATTRRERSHGFRARLRYSKAVKGFAATLSAAQVNRLRADANVAAVAQDRIVTAAAAVPLAPGEPLPPTGVRRIETATTSTARQPSSVGVAVLDTGIDLDHPDLDAAHGSNCVTPSAAAEDDDGHGTHVAGTIGARNNGAGVVGVAPGTRVFAVKVLDHEGAGTTSQVICGIDWITGTLTDADPANDVPVANMSLGATGPPVRPCQTTDDPMHLAICASTAAGATYVVAAGNNGWEFDHPSEPDVPAAYPQVLTVTAMSDSDGRPGALGPICSTGDDTYADYSNYALTAAAADHTIAAPGSCISSTWPGGGHRTLSGTSMATPHVAGVVALCLGEAGARGRCAGQRPAEIISRMRAEAQSRSTSDPGYGFAGDPLRPAGGNYYFGHLVAADTRVPAVTLTEPAHGSTIGDTTPTFSGRAGDARGDAALVDVDVFAGSTAGGSPVRSLTATRTATTWSTALPAGQALPAGTYTARARQASANGEATSGTHTFTVAPEPPPAGPSDAPVPDAAEPAPAPAPPPPAPPPAAASAASPPAAASAASPPGAAPKEPAKLQVQRAQVRAGKRTLEIVAPITRRASGAISLTFQAAGRTTRFRQTIRSGSDRLRIVRTIPRAQARQQTGILTLSYPGNDRTRPQEVRLRAAPRAAQLSAQRPQLANGRLVARGRVSAHARGVVRIQLDWSRDGRARSHELSARISNGRWRLSSPLPAAVRDDIAARDGTLHSYVLFTGYGPRRIRGEMRSFEVLPAP